MGSNNFFIDTHFHILPGVDDGATDVEMALEMARLALADGVHTIIATPHPNPTSGIGSHAVTLEAVANFQAILNEHGLKDLLILPGVECYLLPEILELLQTQQLFPLNDSRYILLEFNHVTAPVNIEQVMFTLRSAGYVPVIAHPERYKYVQTNDNIEWVTKLVRLGCITQVTAGSLYGRFGKNSQRSAELLLQHNLLHVIASDAHNLKLRAPGISLARPLIEHLVGPAKFLEMAVDVPGKIIANSMHEPEIPELVAAKPFWKFW